MGSCSLSMGRCSKTPGERSGGHWPTWTKCSQGLCCLVGFFNNHLEGSDALPGLWVWAFGQARGSGQGKIPQPLETESPLLSVEQLKLMPTRPPPHNKQAFPLSKGKWEANQKRACLLKRKDFLKRDLFPSPPGSAELIQFRSSHPKFPLFGVPSLQPTRASPLPGWGGPPPPAHYNEQRRGPWLTDPGPPRPVDQQGCWLRPGKMARWGDGVKEKEAGAAK